MRLQILNSNNGIIYSTIPPIDEMLSYELWELHEAAFILTRWPDHIIQSQCKEVAKIKNIPRSFIYEAAFPPTHPSPLKWQFNPSELGPFFLNTYSALREAVSTGELESIRIDLGINTVYGRWKKKNFNSFFEGEWVSVLLSSNHVVEWAFLKGICFQEDLQKAKKVSLMVGKINRTTIKMKVKLQFLQYYFPGERIISYCKHAWMKEFVSTDNSIKDPYQVIRKTWNELRDPNRIRKQGNHSTEDIKNESYYQKAIEEVVRTDSSGTPCYYIPSLKLAMETAAHVLLNKYIDDDLPKMNRCPSKHDLDQFLHAFMQNRVVSLYTANASRIISEFVKDFAYRTVEGFFLSS